jgi:hypothetical protein
MQNVGVLHGAAAKAAEKKPKPNKPRHIKVNSLNLNPEPCTLYPEP